METSLSCCVFPGFFRMKQVLPDGPSWPSDLRHESEESLISCVYTLTLLDLSFPSLRGWLNLLSVISQQNLNTMCVWQGGKSVSQVVLKGLGTHPNDSQPTNAKAWGYSAAEAMNWWGECCLGPLDYPGDVQRIMWDHRLN